MTARTRDPEATRTSILDAAEAEILERGFAEAATDAIARRAGVVAKEDVKAVRFGEAVREALEETALRLAPLQVKVVAFPPERVAVRLSELNRSLLLGVLIVA